MEHFARRALLICAVLCGCCVLGLNIAGRYDCVKVNFVMPCDVNQSKDSMVMDWHLKKFKDGKFLSGYSYYPYDLDDSVSVLSIFSLWTNGGWKKSFEGASKRYCQDYFNVIPDILNRFKVSSGMKEGCPIPKGNHTLGKLSTCHKLKNFPLLPYGHYLANTTFYKNKKLVGCWLMDVDVMK